MYKPPISRTKMTLAAVSLALVLACIWALSVGDAKPPKRFWLPELLVGSDKLTKLVIDDPAGLRLVDAVRKEGGWRDQSSSQLLQVEPLAALVIAMARSEVVAAETSLRENYGRYHQFEPGKGEGTAWRIELGSDGGYQKVLWIGDDGGPQLFVRVNEDPTIFRLNGRLPLPERQPGIWLQQP